MRSVYNNYHALTEETLLELDTIEAIQWQWKERKNINVNYDREDKDLNFYDIKPKKFRLKDEGIMIMDFKHKEEK